MKVNKSVITIFLMFICVNIFSFEISQTINFGQPALEEKGDYVKIELAGCRNIGNPGEPEMPRAPLTLLLPSGHIAQAVELNLSGKIRIPGNFNITPVQRQYPIGYSDNIEFTQPDPLIYNSEKMFPAEKYAGLQTHFSRGHSIAFFNICPFEYYPVSGELYYYSEIDVTVSSNIDPEAFKQNSRFYRSDERTRAKITSLIDNPEAISLYSDLPENDRYDQYDYLIITNSELEEYLLPLVNYKNITGILTEVRLVENIQTDYTGDDLQEKIRNCIIDQYENQGIEYVLLAGDVEIIPHRGFADNAGGYEYDYDIPADIYYSNLDGTWNDDGDNLWGEPGEDDLLGEVFIGRMSGDSPEEITNFVNKTIMYQSQPFVEDIQEALMIGEDLGWIAWGMDYKEEIRLGSDSFGYTTAGIAPNFNVNTLYDHQSIWSAYGDLLPLLNEGPNLVNHMGHCNTTYAMKLNNPDITENNITNDGVENGFNIIYSQGCYCGAFDNRTTSGTYTDDCITEVWTGLATGPVAMVTNSRYGWGDIDNTDGSSQYFDRQFFDAIFGEDLTIIGETQQDSKEDNIPFIDYIQNRWCFYCSNLFGDPTLDIWTDEPEDLTLNHNGVYIIGQQEYFLTVHNTAGFPVENARVALSVDNVCVGRGMTNVSGIVNVHLSSDVIVPGEMTISVTGHNLMPVIDTIPIIPPEGPYVILENYSVLSGDDDYIEAGETVYLDINLQNIGVEAVGSIEMNLTSDDTFLTFIEDTVTFTSIAPGETVSLENAFSFSVSEEVPDHHPVQLAGTISSESETWNTWINLMIYEPNVFSVEPGAFELELGYQDIVNEILTLSNTSDRIVDYTILTQKPLTRDITGSYISCNTAEFTPGETTNWLFTIYNLSPDNEWISDIVVDFPAGVTVNAASDFVGGAGGPMLYDGTTGEAVSLNWHGETSMGYGVLHQNQAAVASVNVTISAEFTGYLTLNYQITGDNYGSDPHTLNGSLQLEYPLSWISLSSTSGTLTSGESEDIDITFDANGLELGMHNCEILISDGDRDVKKVAVSLHVTNTDSEDSEITIKPALIGNYPNPFNPLTKIFFSLNSQTAEKAELSIYNLKGQKIRQFPVSSSGIKEDKENEYSIIWDGTDHLGNEVPSGIYFYRLQADEINSTRKMLLLK
jgi:hypothetical protein